MRHPLASLPPGSRAIFFVALFILTLVVLVALNALSAPLQTEVAPAGIISYELAGTVEKAQAILDSWDATAKVYASFNLGLDYLFMLAYSATIALGIIWLAEARPLRGLALRSAGLLAWGQLLAAVLDAVENAALLIMLVDRAAEPWPLVARWCAIPKFGLVALGILFVSA
jgi:hypothetical protein